MHAARTERLAIYVMLALCALSIALTTNADAATTLSPNHPPDGGYQVGNTVRACSTNGMAVTPAPRITAPSGAFTLLTPDSDACVSFRFEEEAGTWVLTYTNAQAPIPAAQTIRLTVGPNLDDENAANLLTLAVLVVWVAISLVSMRIKQKGTAATLAMLGFVCLIPPVAAALKLVISFGNIGLLASIIFRSDHR